jgi:peptidoglycan/xylan/chitin deacetylase (PgdA/CDA1 family)
MTAGTLILLYHRVAHLDRDPYEFAVRPDRFAQQCDILRRRCDIVPLWAANGAPRQVAITFDDGYADNTREACSILTAARLPATFFITTGRVGERAEVWWDRLEQILLEHEPAVGHIDIEIDGCRLWVDIRSSGARARAHLALYWRLRRLRPAAIELILTQIEDQLGVQAVDRETHRWMNVEELRALSAKAGVDVGAHTLTHPLLASLPAKEQWQEIDGSRDQLERLLEMPVRLFSYPYGGHDTFDAVTTQLVREAGYTLACTGTGGLARPDQYPFLIPRNVVGDWDAGTFEQWLDRWFGHP